MTNDINTLNGALKEAGETLAANLTTQGVPSTWDEGLTTLIGKVLDIGPTPPTPTPASITLTADKSILSYADSESAVLTATVLDSSSNPVEGVSVDLYKDSVLWDTLTTGSAGTVSKTYTSAGVGDVGFTAECGSFVTENFPVQDCIEYDTLTTDKQKYTVTSGSATLTYNNNGLKVTGTVATDTTISNSLILPSEYVMEVDIDWTSSVFWTSGLFVEDRAMGKNNNAGNLYFYILSTNTEIDNVSLPSTTGTLKIERTGTSLLVYWNDTLIKTLTNVSTTNKYGFRTYNNRSATFKNLKIKPL